MSLLVLVLLSMPWLSNVLQRSLETYPPIQAEALRQGQAIVVLGAGAYYGAPEFGGLDVISRNGLARVRYAAYLHRQTGLPILVAGGAPRGGRTESEIMREVLEKEFQVAVRWQEARSHTTAENAEYSLEVLAKSDVKTVVLVTDATHMPRATLLFERVGMIVLPAPTGFATDSPGGGIDLPSANALERSAYAIREWLALSVVRLR
ncbi:MAG: YdcF family protein [Sterolibacterium sp.]